MKTTPDNKPRTLAVQALAYSSAGATTATGTLSVKQPLPATAAGTTAVAVLKHSLAGFLTQSEIDTANELQSEYERLVGHSGSTSEDSLRAKLASAQAAYAEDPSEENHDALIFAALLAAHGQAGRSQVQSTAYAVLDRFVITKVARWLYPIVSRNIDRARAYAEKVIEAEKARAAESGLGEIVSSPFIQAAVARAGKLEAIEARLFAKGFVGINPMSPASILRDFAGVAPFPPEAAPADSPAQIKERHSAIAERFLKENGIEVAAEELVPIAVKRPSLLPTQAAVSSPAHVFTSGTHPLAVQEG